MDLDNFDETGAHAMADDGVVPIEEDDPFAESGVVPGLVVTSLVSTTRAFSVRRSSSSCPAREGRPDGAWGRRT